MDEQRDPSTEPVMDSAATLNPDTATAEITETPASQQPADATPEAPEADVTAESRKPLTKEELIGRMAELAGKDPAEVSADDISRLKQHFYALRNEELRAERDAFVEANGSDKDYIPSTDIAEEQFKLLLNQVKEKKAAHRAAVEAEQQANYDRKKEIVAKLVEMGADADNANLHFNEVRELQESFKAIGEVPPTVTAELWKSYQDAVEKFYDQLKINKELRDYDFKKNLGEKQNLIAEAERLQGEEDIILAFRRLQDLHNQWRAIGPVPKDLREEIWGRFKEISADINKRYQDYFVERKTREQENETAKTALCEKVEALDFSSLSTYAAWDAMTRDFISAQEEWRKLGYASRKVNNVLFARFRAACDKFFAAKAEFFKQMKDVMARNLEKKIALCERAEALKESTDWKAASDELTAMQKEWKTIGTVAKKYSDQVWRRFLDACDYFFERKKKNTSGTRRNERANLEQKADIIAKLKEIAAGDLTADREGIIKKVKDLQAEWQSVGHVPFAEKDNIYNEYRAVCDDIYGRLNVGRRGSRMEAFENSISEIGSDQQKLYRERERLLRVYEQRKGELQTYENNMGFLSAKTKNADSMLREMQRRMQRLRDNLAELEAKIKSIDSRL